MSASPLSSIPAAGGPSIDAIDEVSGTADLFGERRAGPGFAHALAEDAAREICMKRSVATRCSVVNLYRMNPLSLRWLAVGWHTSCCTRIILQAFNDARRADPQP